MACCWVCHITTAHVKCQVVDACRCLVMAPFVWLSIPLAKFSGLAQSSIKVNQSMDYNEYAGGKTHNKYDVHRIRCERDRPWRSSHDASSRVGPGPLPMGFAVHPHPWRFVLVSVPTCGKMVPSRSFSWTPRSLDTTKWKMVKYFGKIARNIPWSFADTCDVFLNYFSYWLGDDSSSQFSDPKINMDIQWYTFFNEFWWFPFKGSTDTWKTTRPSKGLCDSATCGKSRSWMDLPGGFHQKWVDFDGGMMEVPFFPRCTLWLWLT